MNSLIKVEGKPIEKLIDVVSKAIGTIYEPRRIVRKAKAEAKAESIKAIEQAKTNAIIEGDTEKAEYLDRINNRLVNKETKRQKNIEEVVSTAGRILEAEKDVSNEPVNPDWTTRFFDIVQDVSDKEMQTLWGQILAGEIKQPKSYSLRTLETLRNMTKEEAEVFQKVAQFVLLQDEAFLFSSDKILVKFGVNYSEIAKLIEIGLLQPGDFVHRQYVSTNKTDEQYVIIYGDLIVLITTKAKTPTISIPIRLLTTVGKELVKLIDITPNIGYLKEFATIFKRDKANVSYAKILSIDEEGVIRYNDTELAEL
ncbi:MAG: DUF2806 domain-containing protein [Bacteroidales bacterium]|nr:DUF2806 domain-containing protein [Bacteroidales bacterium]